MSKLLRVELRRFFSRDVVLLFGLILAIGIVLVSITPFIFSTSPSSAERAKQDRHIRASRTDMEGQIRQCQTPARRPALEFEESEGMNIPPEVLEEMNREAQRGKTRRECLQQLGGNSPGGVYLRSIESAIFPLALLSLIMGATLIGAEWTSGAMTTQLTWEPRRLRLFAFKALAVAVGALAVFIGFGAALALGLLPSLVTRGTFVGIDQWWWEFFADLSWRGGLLQVLASVLGFGVAGMIRNTVAAVGGLFGYLVIVENILRGVAQDLEEWLIINNLLVAMVPSEGHRIIPGRSPEEALLVLCAYTFGILAISGFLFWRRDVTGPA